MRRLDFFLSFCLSLFVGRCAVWCGGETVSKRGRCGVYSEN